ncbi:MAG: hypothetical protein ABSG56_11065 [Bryobacteraceae bacterium]
MAGHGGDAVSGCATCYGGAGGYFAGGGSSFQGGEGVYAVGGSPNGWAGEFDGTVNVSGYLSKSSGSFKIDHPLDPANKYLYHSFVESPDMMNVYNGNVTTDGSGHAIVTLPDWFQALNSDFRYQLTAIGQPARAWVASEVNQNNFAIGTDKPNVKVSWQVTGIRQDAWANAHRIAVEAEKAKPTRVIICTPSCSTMRVSRALPKCTIPVRSAANSSRPDLEMNSQRNIKR